MSNKRGQANIIVSIGMVAAVIFVMFSAFNYINTVGLSSQIEITAQNSIFQTLATKDYVLQQANYLFDKAQLFDAFQIAPVRSFFSNGSVAVSQPPTIDCGYINATTRLPFIPVAKVYYWHNANGYTCLPDNQEILYGLTKLLNQSIFSEVNTSGLNIHSFLDLNLTKASDGLFKGNFTAPYLNDTYTIVYNRNNFTYPVKVIDYGTPCKSGQTVCPTKNETVYDGPIGGDINLNGSIFSVYPENDIMRGVLDQQAYLSPFFSGANVNGFLSPNAQFAVTSLPNGVSIVIYSTQQSVTTGSSTKIETLFYMTPLLDQNVYTLNAAIKYDEAHGLTASESQQELYNNSAVNIGGIWYNFTISTNINGVFNIFPENYSILPFEPHFVYYKYILNQFDQSGTQNLLFPNYKPLHVSFSLFPLYNPEVCLSYNEVQFTLQNCLSVSGYFADTNYISQIMQLGTAFVNQSFPIGSKQIQGFAQYELYNYLENVVHGVNLKTVSVNGQPKYDWYSALLLALGSPNGESYILNQLAPVKENYYGTTVYNCSKDITLCRNLLSTTISQDIMSLFNSQIPKEVSFLSGTPFNVNVLNLSVNATEKNICPNYNKYNASVSYSFKINSTNSTGPSEEVLGIPISINFAYQNGLNLTPSESCGIQNSPYESSYPGFSQTLVGASATYLNCAPITAAKFLNNTCVASVETNDPSMKQYFQALGATCQTAPGSDYFCEGYKFDSNSPLIPFYYERRITQGNSCPSYVVVNGENFSYSPNTGSSKYFYKLISMYGGGATSVGENYDNWTMAVVNGTNLDSSIIPDNFSVNVGVAMKGPSPSFNLLLSSNPSLSSQFTAIQLNGGDIGNAILNYTSTGLVPIASSQYSSATSVENNLQVNKYCYSSNNCTLSMSVNGINGASILPPSAQSIQIFSNGLKLLGLSTGSSTSEDIVNYFFVNQYSPGYNPVNFTYPAEPESSLNGNLYRSFGLSASNNTYYTLLVLNPRTFSTAYQLPVAIDSNFNASDLLVPYIKVFGMYTGDNTPVQLSWWNQTPMQPGSTLWVNLTRDVPDSLYVVYGSGAFNPSDMADNGSLVFPLFYSASEPSLSSKMFTYPKDQHNFPPSFSSFGINLTNLGVNPPNIYNSTISAVYQQFACISTKPVLRVTLINATYSPYPTNFSINSLYNNYNPLYPNLTIIGEKSYNNWALT